jgi:hypothetical protein
MSDWIRAAVEKDYRLICWVSSILFVVGFLIILSFIVFYPSREVIELKETQFDLEQDLAKCQDSLDTWQTWCSIFEAEIEIDAFGYPRFVCRQGEKQ